MKTINLKLTKTELEYMYSVASRNKEEGIYWGREDQFIKRQYSIIDKLTAAIDYFDKSK
jgi:hypothetical protein